MNKNELTAQIEAKQAEIKVKQAELDNFELDVDDYEDIYKAHLDEEGPVIIAGMKFDPSYALQEIDPTAYRCGLNDYVDSFEKEDDPKYKELEEELESLTEELDALEAEIEDLDD
jgi:peptidoglycan hydrolase CwlO-like protein